jgi:hypothetical protein
VNPDPAASLLRAGNDALLRVAGVSLLLGVAAALLAAILIYLGASCLPPRAPRGQVWAQWRRHAWLWSLAPSLGLATALLAADVLARAVGAQNLLWMSRLTELRPIAWLGAGIGYLFALFVMVMGALLTRRRP